MNEPFRQTLPLMRFALILGAILTFLSGVQLFVLTEHTEESFAWTIAAGSTAAVIGAFYWAACALAFLSWLRQPWVRARVGVPGVTLFLWAMLFTTLVHLDKFHLFGRGTGQVAAWAWLVIYVVDPIIVTVAFVLQWRSRGVDPPRSRPLTPIYRLLLGASAVVFVLLGLLMLFVPDLITSVSPYPLTALTSRAIGSWVVAMGVVFATMASENDTDRIRPAAIACLVLSALLGIGMLRFWGHATWDLAGWLYLLTILFVALIGAFGLFPRNREARAPQQLAG